MFNVIHFRPGNPNEPVPGFPKFCGRRETKKAANSLVGEIDILEGDVVVVSKDIEVFDASVQHAVTLKARPVEPKQPRAKKGDAPAGTPGTPVVATKPVAS